MQKQFLQVVHQSSLLDYFKPDVELDDSIVIIGAREHNTSLFEPFLEEFSNCKIFALDTETFGSQGVEALYFYYNKVRLLQIGLESGKVLIIDFGGWLEESRWEDIKDNDKVKLTMSLLSEKCFANDVAVLGVNLGGFDFPVIRHHFGIIARQARDIMILSQVVRAGIGSYKHGMTALCALSHGLKGVAEWLGYEVDKTEQTSAWGWNLSNSQLNYSAVDVRILFPIFSDLRNLINELGLQYSARAESRAVGVFANMQFLGFPIRISEAERIRDEEIPLREQYLEEFNSYFPGVQYSSQQQTLAALRTIFPDLEDIQKATLKKLDHPAASALYKLKESDKLIDDCKNLIERSFNGSIHSLFNQIGPAATGRSTSKSQIGSKSKAIYIGINLQNASKKVRSIFGYDDDSEMCLGIYDGSGMHQRIATELSQDPNLIAGYLEGLDMHSKLAAEIAKVLGEDPSIWTYEYVLANKDEGKAKKYRDLAKKAFYSCVPLETKALTRTGWKGYGELELGEDILAYDIENDKNVWTPCLDIIYKEAEPVYEWRIGKSKVFKSTSDHRWFGKKRVRSKTGCATSFKYYKDFWFETQNKSTECIIINSAKAESGPGTTLDRFIHKNLEDDYWTQLVLDMSESERWAWFSANIATDGYIDEFNVCKFTQDITKQPGLFYAMQLCGYLLGYNPVVWKQSDVNKKCWVCNFQIRHSTTLQQCKEIITEPQPVWCVRTAYDTWVTKTEDYITITGNCLNGSGVGKILIGLHDLGFVQATREHAQEIYNAYYALYENLVNFIKTKQKETSKDVFRFDFQDKRFRAMNMHLRDYGRLQALTGRIQYIEMEENKWGEKQVNYTKTCASNWLLVEGDLLKMWMAEVQDKFWETPEWNANIINMVHDEINLVCSEQYKQEVADFVVQKMEEVFSAFITIIPALEPKMINNPTCGMCKNWSEK